MQRPPFGCRGDGVGAHGHAPLPSSSSVIDGLGAAPNPFITTGETGRGARPRPLRPIRFHPVGAACRGEAAPRPYFLVAYPHIIDGLGAAVTPPLRLDSPTAFW